MPERYLQRQWCKKCQSCELFEEKGLFAKKENPGESHWSCIECGTKFEPYKLSEVPKEKIKEQRERYKVWKKEQFEKMFGSYLDFGRSNRNFINDMFSAPGSRTHVTEADAGQKYIDDQIKKEREAEYEKRRAAKEALEKEYEAYRKSGRNDKCLCGSGKKYKHCCLPRFQNI